MRLLSDRDVAGIREGWAAGGNAVDLSAEFGCSRRHVERLCMGDSRSQINSQSPMGDSLTAGSVCAAVERFVEGISLDDAGEVLAATAWALAAKLDACAESDAAASSAASPGLARELSAVMAVLRGDDRDSRSNPLAEIRARRIKRLEGLERLHQIQAGADEKLHA